MPSLETANLLKQKVLKILGFLFLIRLGFYIPVPNVDLDIFSQESSINPLFGLAKNLTGSSYLGIGSLGILPYINSSIVIQLLTPLIPSLEKLQKEEGELGRQQISKYTRYLTLVWSIFLSSCTAFFIIRPIIFNWSLLLAIKIITALTTTSMLSMWFAELITNEGLGNGSSMIIFINIIGGIPLNLNSTIKSFNPVFNIESFLNFGFLLSLYLGLVALIILVQGSYKKVPIVSARQLNFNASNSIADKQVKNSFIPIKLNQGGIMPLVFSTTVASLVIYLIQISLNFIGTIFPNFLVFLSFGINLVLIIFFSSFYALLVLKPKDLSDNLTKMAYNVPGLRQGKETTRYLEKVISRLAFMGGIFLAFLAFFPLLLGSLFKNVTSLIILIGVITDTSSQVRSYLVSQNYEGLK